MERPTGRVVLGGSPRELDGAVMVPPMLGCVPGRLLSVGGVVVEVSAVLEAVADRKEKR